MYYSFFNRKQYGFFSIALLFLFQTGPNFRKSSDKDKQDFEFVPVNLHLQRMWVENDSLRKSGTYDTITHGAFTSIPIKSPGLIK